MPPKRYDELDALRGIAAFSIMLFHYNLVQEKPFWLFNMGVTAVDLFFMISGFVIFMSINKVASGAAFVINRISRLYPTYWACVTFTFGIMILVKVIHFHINHEHHVGITDYLGNLTMFQYYLSIPNLEVPYWTMLIEMLFYILILLLFKLNLLKHITLIGCFINAIILLNYWLIIKHIIPNYNSYFPLVNHFALFFAGMSFYKIITDKQHHLYNYVAIVFCLFTQITLYRFSGSDPDHITQYQYTGMLILYFSIFVLFVNGLLKFIILRPVVFIGKISFALYLIHSFFFRGLISYFWKQHHFNFWLTVFFIAMPLAVLLATVITLYIEKPLGKRMKQLLSRLFTSSM
jgi:peptidoglycan/LPS O-acetylase OafA/YrhL